MQSAPRALFLPLFLLVAFLGISSTEVASALTYLPGRGTELALNGTPLIVIEGADFAAAYFGIWLGREPIDDKLKRDLLKGR